jgi:hypothetical protein
MRVLALGYAAAAVVRRAAEARAVAVVHFAHGPAILSVLT